MRHRPIREPLREQPGKDIWLMGGGDIIARFSTRRRSMSSSSVWSRVHRDGIR